MRITIVFIALGVAGLVEQAGGETLSWLIMIAAFLEYFSESLQRAKETAIALFNRAMATTTGRVILIPVILIGSVAGGVVAIYALYVLGVFDMVLGVLDLIRSPAS